jgi:hypothetical protein
MLLNAASDREALAAGAEHKSSFSSSGVARDRVTGKNEGQVQSNGRRDPPTPTTRPHSPLQVAARSEIAYRSLSAPVVGGSVV